MSKGLHLELDKKQIPGSIFSQGVLTLEKAGNFTVQIKEYQELLDRRSKLDLTKGRTLVDPAKEKENEEITNLFKKFETLNWAWNTVYHSETLAATQNLFVAKGFPFGGKTFTFPEVLEGGGYCYVEAFFEGETPVGKKPNGIFINAIGTPKIVRVEWTDMQYRPIKDTKVAFGSHLLLHIYTQGLYGQDILVGLKDIDGLDKDLNIANSSFFDIEVKTYPVQEFEKNHPGVSGLLVKSDNPKQATTTIQKAVIEVGIDFAWMFVGDELQIETHVINKSTREGIPVEDGKILNVSGNGTEQVSPLEITNMPVVVGEIDTIIKDKKKPIDFTFGIFLDGTLNNMYNTEIRKLAEGKDPKNTTGLAMSKASAFDFYTKKLKKADSSYENDLSNPAILFKNYLDDEETKLFKVYIEGIGTNSSPSMPKATDDNPTPVRNTKMGEKDYKKDDIAAGPAFGQGTAGIMDRVKKSIEDVVSVIKAQRLQKDKECVGTITFDVFGFSRGAAAARHFVHIVTHGPYVAKNGENLQYDLLPLKYFGKLMPQYGILGQLLTEAELMDDQTQVKVRFVGIYDTVPHHGLFQDNDIQDLGLNNVNRADYVVHMVAADEHRLNFSLADISSVNITPPYTGKKGGIELIYPGVHSDVGGSYEEGRIDNPKRIDAAAFPILLTPLKEELMQQGWFSSDKEIFVVLDPFSPALITGNDYRLEGKRKLSNQYSYIPLHHMAEFCTLKKVPMDEETLLKFYKFKSNFIDDLPNVAYKNVPFLEDLKIKLWDYTFGNGKAITFESFPKEVAFLRNHYLHWNSSYDITNLPHKEGEKRKRYIR